MYRAAHAAYTQVMAECLRCGAFVADSSRFCSECGAPVVASLRSRQELRKTVTILFCDVVDSTVMGEQSDPETVRHAMSRYSDEMSRIVERHGGVVEHFRGDEVMAVFGVPTVHEDDALRAVRTGMAMQRRLAVLNQELQATWGVTLACRIGINTGEVVAGDPGTGATFVTGDAVNLAKRLEQAAAPGAILIGMATYPLVRDAVTVGRRERFSVKGKREPVSAFRLQDVDATAAGVTRRLDAPLVDREVELRLLQATADASEREPPSQLFTVVGPAGIGKSRLVTELLDRLDGRFRRLRGRCLPYGEAITFWPVRGIVDEAGGEEALAALLADVEDGVRIAELIRTAVGQTAGAAAAEETFWAIRRMLEELARDRPLVVFFDDVHWASPTLLDLIEYLAGWMRDARVLILVLARSELLELRPTWATPRANATILALEPLTDAESNLLLARLADDVDLPAERRQRIVGTAEGNPFFVEQMAAMAVEAGGGADRVRMPPTIQALLAERLDRLSAPERMLLERASVIGKEFFHHAVMDLMPPDQRRAAAAHLFSLIRKDLVGPIRSDRRGDVLAFRHDLIRVAAYDAVPKVVRAELHEQFADWLKEKFVEQIGELEEIVGHHLEQAARFRMELGRMGDATDELAVRAGTHLAEAGRRAFARGDVSAASKLLERAASLLEARPETRAEVLLDLGAVVREQGTVQADAVLSEAETLAESAGDQRLQMRVQVERSILRVYLNPGIDARQVLEVAERARPVFEPSGDQLGLLAASVLVANAHWSRCHYEMMEEELERARGYAQRVGDRRTMSWILGMMCRVTLLGPLPVDQGIRRCLAIQAQHHGEPIPEHVVDSILAVLEAMRGRFAHARKHYQRSHLAFDELGLNVRLASFRMYAGWAELIAGDATAAERQLRVGYEALERMGEQSFLSTMAALLARAVFSQGRYDEAERLTQVSDDAISNDLFTQAMWRGTRAKLLARRGDADAERLARESVELSLETDCLNLQADALVDLAETLRLLNRGGETRGILEEAISLYETKGNLASATTIRRSCRPR
jgi:class 3 adenylate cyclase/tetratricopeptide (TPR) repeat protein